jgi:hypothetical protein
VRCRFIAIEQARASEKHRAFAHRADVPRVLCLVPEEVQVGAIGVDELGEHRRIAAGHPKRVILVPGLLECLVHLKGEGVTEFLRPHFSATTSASIFAHRNISYGPVTSSMSTES